MKPSGIENVITGAVDFGEIPNRPDMMSGVYMGDGIVMTKLWSGHPFLAFTGDMITAPHLINSGVNEAHNSRTFVSLVRPGDVVVDVGASVGYFSVLAGWRANPGGRIWAFEPNPKAYNILSDNLFINGYKEMMTLHRAALSDRTGSAPMRIFPGYEATSSIRDMPDAFIEHTARETGRQSHVIEVETKTLDEVMRDVPEIDVMKIDAEGHEPAIMRGAEKILRRSSGIKIIMEFVPPIMGRDAAGEHVEFLRHLGFAFHHIAFDGSIRPNLGLEEMLDSPFLDLLLIRNM